MNKKRIEGRRGDDELAQHSEVAGSCPGGKSDVCAGKQRVLTWGDPEVGNDSGKSAEIVVVADKSGASSPSGHRVPPGTCCAIKPETDQGNGMKDRTEEDTTDRAKDGRTRVSQTWPANRPRAVVRETEVESEISRLIATGFYRRAARAGV
jgi:hypothetical protein